MRAQFVLTEILIGIRRNVTMTIAVIVSVAVSLSLLGVALLVRQQANTMKGYWYDKIQVTISFCVQGDPQQQCPQGSASDLDKNQVKAQLDSMEPNQVKTYYYESQAQAYQLFQQSNNSQLASSVTAGELPDSYRVSLQNPNNYQVIQSAFAGKPGVEQVYDEQQVLGPFLGLLNGAEWGSLWVAVVMLVLALVLIVNTVRLAAFSRRRETGIMRLVGASNFYIQLPFLLEGAVAGLIGALLASGALALIEVLFVNGVLVHAFTFTPFIGWNSVLGTLPILLVIGVLLASAASALTLRRYLRV